MTTSLRITLSYELKEVIARHFLELGRYISLDEPLANQVPDRVLAALERLSDICYCPPGCASYSLYQEACQCRATLERFLKHMNQEPDKDFEETQIGQIWQRACGWCSEAGKLFQRTIHEVWDMIAPARPDALDYIGDGVYEARWWKPVPVMDVEILRHTEGIQFEQEPFEPKQLPGGLAVRFAVVEDVQQAS
ncbi:MAG TPA: hypothetical protein VKY59_12965 [Spirillospora sp.]|nr:hypothetical protein [Spirillospora sp.]